MAQAWREPALQALPEGPRYLHAWRQVDRRAERASQLAKVLEIGQDMARLTRAPGLRLALKMMRGPASAAGLSSLQRFLEAGFDTFGQMARHRGQVEAFLDVIRSRESALIAALFDAPLVASETEIARTLGQVP